MKLNQLRTIQKNQHHHRRLLYHVSINYELNGKFIIILFNVNIISNQIFRVKRETEERTKTAAYLSRVFTGNDPTPDATPEPTPIETDDRKRRYNSQFNPDFAKQNTQDFSRKKYS